MYENNIEKIAVKTAIVTIIFNLLLTVFKFVAGFLGHSLAMVSDAIHSASDVFSTVIVIIGIKISAKAADKDHEFGHERYECVAAILLAVLLFATGGGIGYSGIVKIVDGSYKTAQLPDYLAMSAAIVSIVVKECMFWYTYIAAKKTNSGALKADAWHHRSDALSSVGSLIGIVGAMCGVPVLDCVAAIVICLLIIKAAVSIFIDAINKMTDKACDAETESAIAAFVSTCDGVKSVDSLMTRLFGNRIYVVLEIACDENLVLKDAHQIAENVHEGVENNFPLVKHVTVHVNPFREEKEEREEKKEKDDKNENGGQ
ncbi:MAG: cation diffusion facilitator family transporter [Clostridiales bacterium]|nr:cation diffusion facilitator family transporter [Clostridiales bacterium]